MKRVKPSPSLAAQPYTGPQWTARRLFAETIDSICASKSITTDWLSDYWVVRMSLDDRIKYIVGYQFPLNNASSVAIAKDKVATFQALSSRGIQTVPHWPLHFPSSTEPIELAPAALDITPLPMVVKPCPGGGGRDVYKVTSRAGLETKLQYLSAHHDMAAISPLIDILNEYRVIILSGRPRIVFRKLRRRTAGGALAEWRHNLGLGANPERINDAPLEQTLTALAGRVMSELGLTYAAVDIVETKSDLMVLEVNPAFGMDRVATHPDFRDVVVDCYREAIMLAFDYIGGGLIP